MSPAPRRVLLLVCGNPDRGDDGAPLDAVASLLPGLPPHLLVGLDVRRCEQLEIEDLVELPDDSACVIVDAALGIAPGSVVRIPLTDVPARDAATGPVARSSHVLPIGQLLAIAEIMRGARLEGSLVAIGGGAFGFGPGLGRPVRRGLPVFQAAIEAALIDAALPSAALSPA
ncbi:MAG: hydrogenase maturation protease [Chloroflexota bacterium]